MQYITMIKIVLSLLPLIIDAVKAIEAAFPQGGNGAAKLDALRAMIEAGYKAGSDAVLSFDALWPTLQTAISSVVSLANASGLFKSK